MMEKLQGKFWTNKNEMIKEIEELGYEVLELNDEYITLLDEDEEEQTMNLVSAGHTIAIIF